MSPQLLSRAIGLLTICCILIVVLTSCTLVLEVGRQAVKASTMNTAPRSVFATQFDLQRTPPMMRVSTTSRPTRLLRSVSMLTRETCSRRTLKRSI